MHAEQPGIFLMAVNLPILSQLSVPHTLSRANTANYTRAHYTTVNTKGHKQQQTTLEHTILP